MTIDAVLLTGGTGFFGRALLRHWRALDTCGGRVPQVTLLSRSPVAFFQRHPEFRSLPWLTLVEGDVTKLESFPARREFGHVLHAAADSTLGPMLTPLQRYEQIVDGTRNLLEFARSCGKPRFLLVSSGGVYGPQPAELDAIPETYCGMPDPLVAGHAYSIAKRAAEHLCALYQDAYGIEVVVARCFAFVGRDLPLDAHFAIGNFIADALAGRPIRVSGDGTPVRSYLDQHDLARWLLVMLERGRPGRAYNVGSGEAITIAALADLVREVIAPSMAVQLAGSAHSLGNFRNRYVPDVSRAREELGLEVTLPLRGAIAGVAAWARGTGEF